MSEQERRVEELDRRLRLRDDEAATLQALVRQRRVASSTAHAGGGAAAAAEDEDDAGMGGDYEKGDDSHNAGEGGASFDLEERIDAASSRLEFSDTTILRLAAQAGAALHQQQQLQLPLAPSGRSDGEEEGEDGGEVPHYHPHPHQHSGAGVIAHPLLALGEEALPASIVPHHLHHHHTSGASNLAVGAGEDADAVADLSGGALGLPSAQASMAVEALFSLVVEAKNSERMRAVALADAHVRAGEWGGVVCEWGASASCRLMKQ